jgi:hypothetical protein
MMPREVLDVLTRAGFIVLGNRPIEAIRRSLERETNGVYNRTPAIARNADNTYAYVTGSLNSRTGKRWSLQFPSLA